MTAVRDTGNCSKVLPDLVGLSIFTRGTHYCCDIRDPELA
jgi:hypothetical protein